MIKVTDFVKKYGKTLAVNKISFSVSKGEIYGFIGQNGAGKTSTIRTLLNMVFKSSGDFFVNGLDVDKDSKKIKSFTSYVPSEVSFYGGYRAIDIFRLSKSFSSLESNIDELCEYFDLDKNRLISELSLGNKKKVSLIQALIRNPELIILDEPTSGLDPFIQEKLFRLLQKKRNEGLTVFLSSHNLREVEKYCDKVLIIKEGKIMDIFDLRESRNQNKVTVKIKEIDKVEEIINFEGNLNELMKSLAKKNIESIEILKSSLEEEFMKYY